MKLVYALAAPIALAAAPATAATIVFEQDGGEVVGGQTDGGVLNFEPLPPGVYDLIFTFSQYKGCCAVFTLFSNDPDVGLGFRSQIRGSRTVEAFRFRVTQDDQISRIVYNLQNDIPATTFSYVVQIAAVPEPMTWALLILGFGAVGGAMRYRRRASINVRYSFN